MGVPFSKVNFRIGQLRVDRSCNSLAATSSGIAGAGSNQFIWKLFRTRIEKLKRLKDNHL